jgi:formylglycine-generating enzyme required for sulfatase activity
MLLIAGTKTLVSAVAAIAATVGVFGLMPLDQGEPQATANTVSVTLGNGKLLEVSRFEVTFADWTDCYNDGGCSYLPHQPATAGGTYSVTGINRFDVDEFTAWINARSDRHWRLPTAREWQELAAELPKPKTRKLFTDPRLAWAADYGQMPDVPKKLRPQGSWGSFGNGVSDLAGNVWEWTSTCAPNASGVADEARCPALLVEGLHEAVISVFVRDPAAGGCAIGTPPPHVGFRLVSDR